MSDVTVATFILYVAYSAIKHSEIPHLSMLCYIIQPVQALDLF